MLQVINVYCKVRSWLHLEVWYNSSVVVSLLFGKVGILKNYGCAAAYKQTCTGPLLAIGLKGHD